MRSARSAGPCSPPATGPGDADPDVHVFVVASAAATLGGLDSPVGAVIAGLLIGVIENMAPTFAPGWVGQEMKLARRPGVHLRRAAGSPVGPVRLDQGGAGVSSDAIPTAHRARSPPHWAIRAAVGRRGTVAFVLYIPTKTETSTILDMTLAFELAVAAMSLNLVLGYGGIDLARPLGVLRHRRLHHGDPRRPVRLEPGLDGLRVGAARASSSAAGRRCRRCACKGVYLALVTLGVAVLFPTLIVWRKLAWFTQGAAGIDSIAYKDDPELAAARRAAQGRARTGRCSSTGWP